MAPMAKILLQTCDEIDQTQAFCVYFRFLQIARLSLSSYISVGLESRGNLICGNNMAGNFIGIRITVGGNAIYHNNFADNMLQTSILTSAGNLCDDGFPSGGSYWSDYVGKDVQTGQRQNEPGSDGISDLPYAIVPSNYDNYPLMKPYPWGQHDIVVTAMTASKIAIGQGHCIRVYVYIFNYGNHGETFSINSYAGAYAVNQTLISLACREHTTVGFTWNTTGFALGNNRTSA